MNEPTEEQLLKLPKWAQDHIARLERQRNDAIKERTEYLDAQTPAPFYEEYVGASLKERRYIQASTLVCEWRGVKLRIDAHDYGNRGCGISLHWSGIKDREVALIPGSHQQARLVSKEDMD